MIGTFFGSVLMYFELSFCVSHFNIGIPIHVPGEDFRVARDEFYT